MPMRSTTTTPVFDKVLRSSPNLDLGEALLVEKVFTALWARRRFSTGASLPCQSMPIIWSKIVHKRSKLPLLFARKNIPGLHKLPFLVKIYLQGQFVFCLDKIPHCRLSQFLVRSTTKSILSSQAKKERTMIFTLNRPCYTLLTFSFSVCSALVIGQAQASVSVCGRVSGPFLSRLIGKLTSCTLHCHLSLFSPSLTTHSKECVESVFHQLRSTLQRQSCRIWIRRAMVRSQSTLVGRSSTLQSRWCHFPF